MSTDVPFATLEKWVFLFTTVMTVLIGNLRITLNTANF